MNNTHPTAQIKGVQKQLELPQVMADIYDEAAYDLSIDYSQPPPPPALSEADRVWVQTLLT